MTHRMIRILGLLLMVLVVCALGPSAARAHRPGDPPHQLYQMGDLTLENNQVIRDFVASQPAVSGPHAGDFVPYRLEHDYGFLGLDG